MPCTTCSQPVGSRNSIAVEWVRSHLGQSGAVIRSLLAFLLRRLLGLFRSNERTVGDADLEIVVLRHQLAILRRREGRDGVGARVEVFPEEHLQAVADVLGDTYGGLTGSEIGRLLAQCGIADPNPDLTKRFRLCEALKARQARDRAGNAVVSFITRAMAPVRYVHHPELFEDRRSSLNAVLSFVGLVLTEDGRMRRRNQAKTLSEAAARTRRMRDEMLRRNVHRDVLRFCQAELLENDCFDAVFEATKGLAERVREMTGLTEDGAVLVDRAFGSGRSGVPVVAFNSLRTVSEQSEQRGLANLMKGVFGTFRNPAAHTPKVKWPVSEPDALDLLATLSLIHRRLDAAVLTSSVGGQLAHV
jgi:uncharacterized protein (TIGR02391 family)